MATKQILLPTAVRSEIVKSFRISRSALDRALKFTGNSARDNMLRKAALRRGGVVYLGAPDCRPEVETVFANGYMRQRFGRRIEVQLHLESNRALLRIDGQQTAAFDGMTLTGWADLLCGLQQLYNRLCARRSGGRTDSGADSRIDSRSGGQTDSRSGNRIDSHADSRSGSRIDSHADSRSGSWSGGGTNSQSDNQSDSQANSRSGSDPAYVKHSAHTNP